MSCPSSLRFRRSYLIKDLVVSRNPVYTRFFSETKSKSKVKKAKKDTAANNAHELLASNTNDRVAKLKATDSLHWPRIEKDSDAVSVSEFHRIYRHKKKALTPGEKRTEDTVLLRGRVKSVRHIGPSLFFIDAVEDGHIVQAVGNFAELGPLNGIHKNQFKRFTQTVRRGDHVSLLGHPYVSKSAQGALSLSCSDLPKIISPCLHIQPPKVEDAETRVRHRHVDLLVNQNSADIFRVRSHIIQIIRSFLLKDDFLEVQTPIIADAAGGAMARPFTTSATEFPNKPLALRIAPELWLKRLVIGGMARVFEIGPAFRNEGLDSTHNPEFTTCEFYKSFACLEDLIIMTEQMIVSIVRRFVELRKHFLTSLPKPHNSLYMPFKRLEFIPALEKALGQKLPNLADDSAAENLIELLKEKSIAVPAVPTLPRILDKLASVYLEPQCEAPTFITHHPACMAPLSKSFVDDKTNQLVSARAELFIQKYEVANMYEEENSPIEQRAKFMEQKKWRDHENTGRVDNSYVEALEWGLPPTGGWGCGIDRLVMIMSGATRISDVLPFGNLRNVVSLSSPAPRTGASATSSSAAPTDKRQDGAGATKKKSKGAVSTDKSQDENSKNSQNRAGATKKSEGTASTDKSQDRAGATKKKPKGAVPAEKSHDNKQDGNHDVEAAAKQPSV